LFQILTDFFNKGTIDANKIREEICKKYGGNWNILIGNELISSAYHESSYIHFKFRKYVVIIFMDINPGKYALILEKMIKTISNSIESKFLNEDSKSTWALFHNLTEDSFDISERLLDKNIINYFIQCRELFPNNDMDLFYSMVGVFVNISEFPKLRERLMKPEFISLVVELVVNVDFKINFFPSYIMANILSEGKDFWDKHMKNHQVLSLDSIKQNLKSKISEWINDSHVKEVFKAAENPFKPSEKNLDIKQLNFNSLKSFNRLLQCTDKIPKEIHCYAILTLNYLMYKSIMKYGQLLREDKCLETLKHLKECNQTEEYVKKLADVVLNSYKLFQYGEKCMELLQYKDSNGNVPLEVIMNFMADFNNYSEQ